MVTVYPPSSPCKATLENVGTVLELNSAAYQVCDVSNTLVCPVIQLYFRSLGLPQAPPRDPDTLTCDDITIPSVQTSAPIEQPGGNFDYALPGKCYNLPLSGSLFYYCGLASVPPQFLEGTNYTTGTATIAPTAAPDPCANYTAPITVCPPSVLEDSSTWYSLRNDTCVCPYNCIDCHGGIVTPFPGKTNASEHRCICSSTTHTADCQGCSASGCGSGAVCDTSV